MATQISGIKIINFFPVLDNNPLEKKEQKDKNSQEYFITVESSTGQCCSRVNNFLFQWVLFWRNVFKIDKFSTQIGRQGEDMLIKVLTGGLQLEVEKTG